MSVVAVDEVQTGSGYYLSIWVQCVFLDNHLFLFIFPSLYYVSAQLHPTPWRNRRDTP